MKKLFLSLMMLVSVLQATAQFGGFDPVSMEEVVTIKGNEGTIEFEAYIDNGYHLYSTNVPKGGPMPLSVKYLKVEGAEIVGDLVAGEGAKTEYDSTFEMDVTFYDESALFTQKFKLTGGDYRIEGVVSYQSCGEGQCYVGRYDFEITGTSEVPQQKLQTTEVKVEAPAAPKVTAPVVEKPQEVKADEKANNEEPKTENNAAAEEVETTDDADPLPAEETTIAESQTVEAAALDKDSKEYHWRSVISELNELGTESSSSLWLIFILGFGAGLVALLTPCVWPIIPMTVSFFLKRSKDRAKAIREAVIYGASIVVIYLLLGICVTLIFGAGALNALSTSAVFNIFFFLMLVAFGASFLGGFELTLPSSWTNKVDEKAGSTTGLLSIFLMAFTLVLVSFSCTGPIIGFMLVSVADSGEILAPSIGMLGFALALALPFTLFALFPSLLKQTPRSGSWMNTIKVVLGFVELAFSLKFLSVADLAYGWGILDRETFLALWIVIFGLLGFYLLGKIKFPHDDDDNTVSVPRFFMALCSLAFAVYMIPGLWGAPLKAVSAFAPPMNTQDFNLYKNEVHAQFDDFDAGMEYARRNGKPVMLDFTGYGCVNCRKMELAVWTDEKVSKLIQDDYVLITLYVDNKTPLPEHIKVMENGTERTLRTLGDKWSYLQRVKFGANAQPFYVLIDNEGNPLNKSYSFDEDVNKYVDFLETGLNNYKK